MKQGIREQSLAPKYPVGLRYPLGDWTFHYCRAKVALPYNKWGSGNDDVLHEQNTAVVAVEGALDLTIVGSFTKDQFKGGYINIWTNPLQMLLRVKGNDAGDGVNTVIHLKDPLLADVALATFTDIHANIYNNCSNLGGLGVAGELQIVCVPLIAVTIGYHFWGLTYGPAIGVAHTGAGLGASSNEKTVYFWPDGSIDSLANIITDGGTAGQQIAGTMLPRLANPAGTPADDIFYMLKLAP
ncbi:hypothetical protein LCGC14_1903110 [marine sediment metagenome]|uniref:Uncharacterized protein n=1 Tax=marine sediment metagenome TaxID=412755 RepID=A0A0F9IU05_9ZZZZ